MAASNDKARLLEQLAQREGLSDAERAVLLEAAKRFRGEGRPSRPSRRVQQLAAAVAHIPATDGQADIRRTDSKRAGVPAVQVEAILKTDGAARGNPGPAGIGAHLTARDGRVLAEVSEYLGEATNNVAEYRALIAGLERALELGVTTIEVFADSELMVKQLGGQYRVKHPGLIPLYERARALLRRFAAAKVGHVRRELNTEADRLANAAIDNKEKLL